MFVPIEVILERYVPLFENFLTLLKKKSYIVNNIYTFFLFTASNEDYSRLEMEVPKTSEEIILDRISQDSQAYPPDLLSFPLRPTNQISPASGILTGQERISVSQGSPKSPSYGVSSINSEIYSRLHNSRYQDLPIVNPKGYVTLPRKPRLSHPENTLRPQVFSTLNGVIPSNDGFNMKLFGTGGNYCSLNKSEMDLGPVDKVGFQDAPDNIEPAPSPAPGTPHATIPRNSLSSPNIHNQLLMLQAMANGYAKRSSDHRSLKVTLTENEGVLKISNQDLRIGYNVNVASTFSKARTITNPTPKPRKRNPVDVKETFLNAIENATQV